MKFRANSRWKAKKRRGCWANRFKMADADPATAPVTSTTTTTSGTPTIENSSEKADYLHTIFHEVKNRSADKISSNSVFSQISKSPKKVTTRASKRKLKLFAGESSDIMQPAIGTTIINVSQIQKMISLSAVCVKCKVGDQELSEDVNKRKGLVQTFQTKCKHCSHTVDIQTSTKQSPNKPFDLNLKSAHAACQGLGYSGLKKCCISFDLPQPVTKKPFNKLCKTIASAALKNAATSMSNAAKKLYALTKEEHPLKIVIGKNGSKVAQIAVSVDCLLYTSPSPRDS